MFSVETLYPISIVLHLLSAALVLLFDQQRRDTSARLWVAGTLLFALGMLLILPFWQLSGFWRYFCVNFCAMYSIFLYMYSIQQLSTGRYTFSWGHVVFSVMVSGSIFFLSLFDFRSLIGPFAGLGFAAVNLWCYWQVKRCQQQLINAYLKVMSYLFLISALLWMVRIPLSQVFNFQLAADPNRVNFALIFILMICILFRQVTYFVLRLSVSHDQSLNREIIRANGNEEQMLASLNALALARDNETGNHILRTQRYVRALAVRLQALGVYKDELTDHAIELMFKAAPLHDIGKVGIPDHILHKPGVLDAGEWEIMKTHTLIGETVLSSSVGNLENRTDVVKKAIEIAGGHHEKWNGKGYPRGLKGVEIPLAARIMSVADMYDALVTRRVYKKQWTHEQALEEVRLNAGQNFDPAVVGAFLDIQDEFSLIAASNRDQD